MVLVHGFTQNTGCWGKVVELLSLQLEVVLVDAPGHGKSGHDQADLHDAGRLVGEIGGTAVYVGYSMGGRMALHLALDQPERVRGLVLIGATAGIEDHVERRRRLDADHRLADELLELGLPAFIDRWLASPLFATLPAESAFRAERLDNRPGGLAASLRSAGTGTQRSLWARLPGLEMPVLLIAGRDDRKFSSISQRMAAAIGRDATIAIEPGGHAVHLHRPHAVASRIISFVHRSIARPTR
ncbi:MAG: alpha/beta fold hydrolase [Nannocystaceae bacterium]